MALRRTATILGLLLLGGCVSLEAPAGGPGGGSGTLPETVRDIAAPHQDLATARLREEDGCYWYRHVGPVETTLLPLRTAEGRPICARPQGGSGAAPAEGA